MKPLTGTTETTKNEIEVNEITDGHNENNNKLYRNQ